MKSFMQYVVLAKLLGALFITELSGRPSENAIIYCEDHAGVAPREKSEGSDENIRTSSFYDDQWNAYSIRARLLVLISPLTRSCVLKLPSLLDKKWPNKNLTYTIAKYSTQFSEGELNEVFRKVFKKWADVSTLKFRFIPTVQSRYKIHVDADIRIEFTTHWSSDRRALGFYPGTGVNTLQFADNIRWTIDERGGANFLPRTATHELGHALGVRHSTVPSSIMYGRNVPAWSADYSLDDDDILAIQRLYGPNPDGYKPKYDPGPSKDTPGDEAIRDEDSNEWVMYTIENGRWVLHRAVGDKWIPLPPNDPRYRKYPEPPL